MSENALIVVPTYDERENIRPIVARIRAAVPAASILIVDDGSPDGTGGIADELASSDPLLNVLHRSSKAGLGAAYVAGFRWGIEAGFDCIVEIDADGSHDPAELPAMLALAAAGNELVIGSRWIDGGAVENWPRSRQAISRIGNGYARFMLRSRIGDMTAGYRVFAAPLLAGLIEDRVASQGYCFQVELAWRAERGGHSIAEHPIRFVERTAGASKMHFGIVAEALWRVTLWGIADTAKRIRPRGRTTRN